MSNRLTGLQIRNFRSLADVTIETNALNVLFGPNGAGKSTLLDAVWLVRDCAVRGEDEAVSYRNYGIGALWDGADDGANISIKVETELAEYEVLLGYSSGRIEPFVGEIFFSKDLNVRLLDRKVGTRSVDIYNTNWNELETFHLREPERLAITGLLNLENSFPVIAELDELLRSVHFYHSRSIDLYGLKKLGSEASHHILLLEEGKNVWSVLLNLQGRRDVDNRYETIINFMKESFPAFKGLIIDATGPSTVYGSMVEKGRRQPIPAFSMSDGHLQMLVHLTALFSEGKEHASLILFDEPEISLHPYALSVFAKAVKLATEEWNKQVFIATHSPVLISQFEPEDILAAEIDESGQTIIRRVSEMDEIKDLLEQYATGSLYMAEVIAAQSRFQTHQIEAVLSQE
ncbi:MAG: AAA family ATPase [Chloroflexi bacterium]|nr:AAA family ATPase [Chloroflexota bacterium]